MGSAHDSGEGGTHSDEGVGPGGCGDGGEKMVGYGPDGASEHRADEEGGSEVPPALPEA